MKKYQKMKVIFTVIIFFLSVSTFDAYSEVAKKIVILAPHDFGSVFPHTSSFKKYIITKDPKSVTH